MLGLSLGASLIFASLGLQDDPEASQPTPSWEVLSEVAKEHGKLAEVDGVVEHLRNVVKTRRMYGRLDRVLDSLANPWSVPIHAADLRDLLQSPLADADFSGLASGIGRWLDQEDLPSSLAEDAAVFDELWEPIADPEVVEMELLEALSAYVAAVHDLLDAEMSKVGAGPLVKLRSGHAAASEGWYRQHFPDGSATPEHAAALQQYREVLVKTKPNGVLRAAAALLRLTEPNFLDTLAKRLVRTPKDRPKLEGFDGDIHAAVGETPESRVVLGGKRNTTYTGDAALIIDLGGKDVYHRAAVVDDSTALAKVVIDIAGDDRYESTEEGPAYAAGGAALVIDRRGKDVYEGGRHAQACAAAGFAMLLDLDGDDVYKAEDFGQGYGMCGIALLYDLEGKDEYEGWSYVQGSGNGSGFSALVDGEGDDTYIADLHWPDVYGDSGPNVHHGAAQGFNLGFRGAAPEIAGGIAALVDCEGEDRYQAGNFSQGGGYYFGFGLMHDGGGDDETIGTRYSQGFGVHQAVGIRWDEGGDDKNTSRVAANLGSAWDEGVGWYIDDEGDDSYEAGGLALGGAAQTAVAVFLDRQGADTYRSGGGAGNQGGAGSSEYHNKQSVGFLLDLGGSRDQYSRDGRGDGVSLTTDWVGLFLDSKEKTLEKWLAKHGRR